MATQETEMHVRCLSPSSRSSIDAAAQQKIKEEMVKADERNTVHIFRTLRNTARVYKNDVAKEVVRLERRPEGAKFEDLRELVSGARGAQVYTTGDPNKGVWSAGVSIGLIHDIPTCDELLKRMEREAEEVIGNVSRLIVTPSKL